VKRWGLASDCTPQPVSAMSAEDLSEILSCVPKNFFLLDNSDCEDLLKTKSFLRDTFVASPTFELTLDLFKVDVLAAKKVFSELVRTSMKMCLLDTDVRCRQECGYASLTRLRSHDDLSIDLKRGPNPGGVHGATWTRWWTQVHGSRIATFSKQGKDNLLILTHRVMTAMVIEYYEDEATGHRSAGSRHLGSFKNVATKVYGNLLEWLAKYNNLESKKIAAVAAKKRITNEPQHITSVPHFPAQGFPLLLGGVRSDVKCDWDLVAAARPSSVDADSLVCRDAPAEELKTDAVPFFTSDGDDATAFYSAAELNTHCDDLIACSPEAVSTVLQLTNEPDGVQQMQKVQKAPHPLMVPAVIGVVGQST
jgi:hypothetical protein